MSHAPVKPLHKIIIVVVVAALLPVAYVWAEFTHRVTLFYIEYHSQPYLNHVDDSYFTSMPRIARIGTVPAAIAVVVAALSRRWSLTAISVIAVIAGLAAPIFLTQLHARQMLVSYTEFAAHEFPASQ